MVLDQIFGHLESHQDTDLSYLNNSTEPLCEMSMDLDDFKFDFDTLSDNLGGWIDVADSKVTGTPAEYADAMLKSDSSIDFDDLKLTEAVRYDCMWSSNPSTHNTISQTTICENNLLDEFLKLMDNSAANFELDLDIKEEVATNPQKKVVVDPLACDRLQQPDSDDITDKCSDVRIFTSLDHSYVSRNVPTSVDKPSHLPSTYPMTPPESSEDEDTSSSISSPSATIITRNTSAYPKFVNVPGGGIYTSTSQQSLLKKRNSSSLSRPRTSGSSQGSGEAKFCLKVKLSTDPSRSLLKQQKLRLVKSSSNHKSDSSPSTSPSSSSFSTSAKKSSSTRIMSKASLIQTSIRRRKEESLKQKHDEAREIHNHMERQRRNELKLAFDELKACMPDIANSDKVSKQMILDTALTNCRLLRSREVSLKQRRDKLKKSHAELQRKLTALHEKRLGMTTTTSASPSSTNRFSSIATNQL
eukprot:TRINITY_DN5161_c0_g1_i2.p1 TRINITY_DN5161_c0_g1~~TRINITY_DN5161_c0_g1_i2.p1  ORF type:complete len:471 (-),score=120.19 TRINITY_DN5161_c0_g1_i2:332-1744(-)